MFGDSLDGSTRESVRDAVDQYRRTPSWQRDDEIGSDHLQMGERTGGVDDVQIVALHEWTVAFDRNLYSMLCMICRYSISMLANGVSTSGRHTYQSVEKTKCKGIAAYNPPLDSHS